MGEGEVKREGVMAEDNGEKQTVMFYLFMSDNLCNPNQLSLKSAVYRSL